MVMQLLPLSVFAATDETSGECGKNLTWRIEDDMLYIEGEGAMYDYGQRDENYDPIPVLYTPPWLAFRPASIPSQTLSNISARQLIIHNTQNLQKRRGRP